MDCQKGGGVLRAPAKSFLKISELESENLGFMRDICGVALRKLNFHLPKVELLAAESYPFGLQKLPFSEQFSCFFERNRACFA